MKKFSINLSLQTKTVTYIFLSSLFIILMIMVVSLYFARQSIKKEAYQSVENKAQELAKWTEKELSTALITANTYSSVIKAMRKSQNFNRVSVCDMSQSLLENDKDFYSVWATFATNGFDANDTAFTKGFEYSTEKGRFTPGYYRANGKVILSPAISDEESETSEYFTLPKKEGKEVILEPYYYSYTGNKADEVLETSIIVPIIDSGEFIGASGVDISLETLQEHIGSIKLFNTGFCKLLSNKGVVAAHPDKSKILKTAVEVDSNAQTGIKEAIAKGELFVNEDKSAELKKKTYNVYVPVKIGESSTPWSLSIVVPVDEIMADSAKRFKRILLFSLVGLVAMALIIYFVVRMIVNPILKITDILHQLSIGHFNESMKLQAKGNDEVAVMANAVNKLIDGLDSTASFAQEIGKGNLNAEYNPLSADDQLGNSLLVMRSSLLQAKKDEDLRKIEDDKRNWATEGLAKFADVLRQDNDNMETLSFNIIKNLVTYMKLNQGGVFVINDSVKEQPYLEMTACFAYDRQKFIDKRIEIGEGLVGACFQEQKRIYLTDIPDNYIYITSGLGQENPKCILIVPLKLNEQVFGVVELASFRELEQYEIDFVEKIAESIASTISAVKVNIRTTQLLEISQQQAEEMRAQEEEMRQNMEEMHATQEEMAKKNAEVEELLRNLEGKKG